MISGDRYFSPDTDSKKSSVELAVRIPVPEESSANKLTAWSVSVTGADGKVYRTYDQSKQAVPPSSIIFDGKDDNGKLLPQGRYQAVVSASYFA